MRTGRSNGNWKGGISSLRTADQLLSMPEEVVETIRSELESSYSVNRDSGCWDWVGRVFKSNGRANLRNVLAYRLMYVVTKGSTKGLCVLHTCDNVLCVNPAHLFLGTNADNSADMVRKGRQASGNKNGSRLHPERLVRGDNHPARRIPGFRQGERNGRALLTNAEVVEIRRRYRPYINNHKPSNRRELAKEFGVSPYVITCIAKRMTWKHLP